jgi:hypothetical protein
MGRPSSDRHREVASRTLTLVVNYAVQPRTCGNTELRSSAPVGTAGRDKIARRARCLHGGVYLPDADLGGRRRGAGHRAALEAFGTDLADRDAVALLERVPTPAEGRTLSRSRIRATLERAGRQRNLDARAAEIQQALRSPQLQPCPVRARANGSTVRGTVRVLAQLNGEIAWLETELAAALEETRTPRSFAVFPDLVWSSAPGCWASSATTEPCYQDARARRCYAGMAPITRASGTRLVGPGPRGPQPPPDRPALSLGVLLADPLARRAALLRCPTPAWQHPPPCAPGARQPPRRLLHGCLAHQSLYSEGIAWPPSAAAAA